MNTTVATPITRERAAEITLKIALHQLREDGHFSQEVMESMITEAQKDLTTYGISSDEARCYVEFIASEVNKL